MAREDRLDHRRSRPGGGEHHGGADRERKRQRVAEPVCEEQFRRRKHDVVIGDVENVTGVCLCGEFEIAVAVDHAFRITRGARRVQPERRLVAPRRRNCVRVRCRCERGVERRKRIRSAGNEHIEGRGCRVYRLPRRRESGRYDQQLRFAVADDVRVIVGGHQRVQRHRNGAGAHRAEETHGKVDAVFETQQYALSMGESARAQQVRELIRAAIDFRIGVRAGVVDHRGA